jgi:hypothetical protein
LCLRCLSGRVADPDPHQSHKLDLAEWLERLTVPIWAKVATSVPDPSDPYVLSLLDPDPDPLVRGTDPDSSISKAKIVKKALITVL